MMVNVPFRAPARTGENCVFFKQKQADHCFLCGAAGRIVPDGLQMRETLFCPSRH